MKTKPKVIISSKKETVTALVRFVAAVLQDTLYCVLHLMIVALMASADCKMYITSCLGLRCVLPGQNPLMFKLFVFSLKKSYPMWILWANAQLKTCTLYLCRTSLATWASNSAWQLHVWNLFVLTYVKPINFVNEHFCSILQLMCWLWYSESVLGWQYLTLMSI